jgi:predicted DNA-binding antitoxin AbrB/MazE fold protein
MKAVVNSSPDLGKSVRAFLELGQQRNRLVHQNFASFALEKTSDEIFALYTEALPFIDRIGDKPRKRSKNLSADRNGAISEQNQRNCSARTAGSSGGATRQPPPSHRTSGVPKAYNKNMRIEVDAVYQNGILRPLQPLDLAENERVVVSITQEANDAGLGQLDADFIQVLRRRLAGALPAPGLEEVRRRLSKIPGSMTADFIAEREDR